MPGRKPASPQQVAAAQLRDKELLATAVRSLQTSEGWQRWLEVRRAFRSYSFRNQMLIAVQAPNATKVAGYRAWDRLGYQVKKGQTAIRILAPHRRKVQDEETGEYVKRIVGFGTVAVFDRAQVDPRPDAKPLDMPVPPERASAMTNTEIQKLNGWASDLDAQVAVLNTDQWTNLAYPERAQGAYRRSENTITLRKREPGLLGPTYVHELCHAQLATKDVARLPRDEEEALVESATYLGLTEAGLDPSDYSIFYVSTWADADSIDKMLRVGSDIDELTKKIAHYLEEPTDGNPAAVPKEHEDQG